MQGQMEGMDPFKRTMDPLKALGEPPSRTPIPVLTDADPQAAFRHYWPQRSRQRI